MISEPTPEKSERQSERQSGERLSFQSVADRVPPQNLEAEEAILGGILVDSEAIGRITDILEGDAFYLAAHRSIYEAALTLHQSGKPADLMTVATWLGDRGALDKVGGQSRLVELYDRTPSAVNIDLYAQLVMDKYLRRRLIRVGNEISDLGHDTAQELPEVLDTAEQKVFNITQARPQDGLVSTAEVLTQTFADIESRAIGQTLPGLACGFYDLDAMTQGFQRGDLIIVAGRPSMGKTSVVLNIARNVASYHKLPVAVFSLEMSRDQLVQRLLSSEVRIESSRLRAGRISAQEWEPLAHEISKLSQLPLYIDDTPNLTVTEMRSRCRRLQAESGGALGLVVVDYLQLMGGNNDNRVQMLSQITRGLKALARELSVPVIALSQLSRGVESRTDKRPMMSDLRECVIGETLVLLADGRRVPIASLVGTMPEVLTMTEDERITTAKSDCIWSVGRKPVFQVQLANGRSITATAQHRIYGGNGWQQLDAIKVGDRIAIARNIQTSGKQLIQRELAYVGTSYSQPSSPNLLDKATSDLFWDEIVSITPIGEAEVFDLTVPRTASWLADGIVSHNSGAIEQDADLIMMIYRDEYYNKDTVDRGIAELIINKHRNGPTGTVKLLFEPQYTQFRNLSPSNRDG